MQGEGHEKKPWHGRATAFVAGLAGLLLAVVSLIQAWDQFRNAVAGFLEPPHAREVSKPDPEGCRALSPEQWRSRYILSPDNGTYHVFVASLKNAGDKGPALAEAERLRARFRYADFEPMFTEGTSNVWAVVIAQGLSELTTACQVAAFAAKCGIKGDAYVFRMGGGQQSC